MNIRPIRKKWNGTLTDRQRFNNQMHYQPIDRCFNMEFGYWDENFKQWPVFVENNIACNEEADILFNFDKIARVIPDVWLCPLFEECVIDETETTKIIRNSEGLIAEVPKDDHGTIPHYIKPTVVTPEDWKKVKNERMQPNRKIDIAAMKKQHPDDRDYPVGIHCGSMIGRVRTLLTFEGLAFACYDWPDMVEDMVETCCQVVENALDQILGHIQLDYACGWEDICFNSGPIVSVNFFRDVVVPRYKRINKKLKAHGIDIWYTDCDGDVRPILPLMLESGINCLFPFEVNGCAHPGALLDEYGKELRIMGGFDKMALGEGKDAIKKYMKSLLPYVERGGYIPFCDHRCPPNVWQEDYFYYLDLKEQMFGMKS
jgi:uroporphyrinogen decarboxylase